MTGLQIRRRRECTTCGRRFTTFERFEGPSLVVTKRSGRRVPFAAAKVVAGVTAFLSTAFLMRYFRRHDDWALNPFAYYCIAAGLGSIAWLLVR